jgi:hypothetical protein
MNANKNEQRAELVARLIDELTNHDPVARKHARERLCRMGGHDVTRALVGELVDPRRLVRWEAVKALSVLADPIAAPGLLHALEDDDGDVRWVAAEGLIALGRIGLLTVLSGLTRRARSIEFCRSAHHVLHDLKKHGDADVIAPVLAALERPEPQVAAPLAAHHALTALKCRQ